MMTINQYIENVTDPVRKSRIQTIVDHIRETYPNIIESCDYAPKTKIPMFKLPNSDTYVAINSPKSYLSLHFGKYNVTEIIAATDSRIKQGVGCAKIPDKVELPMNEIKEAIKICFK